MNHMSINDKRWHKLSHIEVEAQDTLGNYSDVFKRILSRKLKGYANIDKFLYPKLEDMYDPFQLKGMAIAVDRIHSAMANQEDIWIYGDYDVDGITSVSLLLKCFKQLAYPVHFYIPDRHEEGYGLNMSAVNAISEQGGKVLITVDCGISSVKEAELARTLGLDMIITDHHECQEQIPNAFAVINPKQADCSYPYKMLAGVGIAYKLSCALLGELIMPIQNELLELAAFGTIADIAPLSDENRIIAKYGLESLSDTKNIGFNALIACSDLKNKKITAGHVGFMLAPKINAAGRIDDPKLGVTLLTTEHLSEAESIATMLKETNDRRQHLEKEILESAIAQVDSQDNFKNEHITIAYGENWNSGVIGIVASRLVEKYHKPTIVFSITDGKAKGSARSIDGFDIFEALCQFNHLYEKFGGHEQAAGLTIPLENFEVFKSNLKAYCRENLEPYLLTPALKVDEIVQVSEVSYHFIEELALLEPYGMSNPKPIFKLEGVQIQKKVLMGKNKEFTKFEIADGVRTFEAVSFDRSGYYDLYKAGDLIDLICHLDINEFKGTQTIQFLIKDIRGYREPLAKITTPFVTYRKAEALRIIEKANQTVSANETSSTFSEDNSTNTVLNQSCEVSSPSSITWSIDSVEGLIYFYNRLYDDGMGHSEVIFCPSANRAELLKLTSVEAHFNLAVSAYSKQQIASWIPDRNELIDFYKQVRSGDYLETPPTTVRLWLCAMILEAAGLISLGSDNVVIEPAPKEKLDLMEVPIYKALQVLKMTYKNA